MAETSEGARLYEAMWVIDPSLVKDDMAKARSIIQDLVEKGGGALVNCEKWEERRLAYPIKKKKRGLYVISHFTSDPDRVARIQRNALLSENILRVLIVKDEDGSGTAPAPPPAEEDREEGWGGREEKRREKGGRERGRERRERRREGRERRRAEGQGDTAGGKPEGEERAKREGGLESRGGNEGGGPAGAAGKAGV
ncbi:MAG: 30S ribosomal protein S6 [Planctomycetota bacterium]|nr:30S ribosomal protein S6 [Planctomycetota bacterium]